MTFPELFAAALKSPANPGGHRCFWCGADCDSSIPVAVTDTFWDWDCVAWPKSKYQCSGCKECLIENRAIAGYDKPQKTRNHSWYADSSGKVSHYTKADISVMRGICLAPPQSLSWGLGIAESGQKHVLYRTPVNSPGGDSVAVQLELLTVVYRPSDLADSVERCARLGAVVGKPPLGGPLTAQHAFGVVEAGLPAEWIDEWNATWNAPVWRLAAFLCPAKAECDAYLTSLDAGAVPQGTSRSDGPPIQRGLFA